MPDPERFSRLHAIYETVQGLPDAPGWLALPFPAEPPAPGGELPSGPGPASSAPLWVKLSVTQAPVAYTLPTVAKRKYEIPFKVRE